MSASASPLDVSHSLRDRLSVFAPTNAPPRASIILLRCLFTAHEGENLEMKLSMPAGFAASLSFS